MSPIDVVLLGGMGVAAVTDLRSGKIPNALTFTMMIMGIVMNATLGGDPLVGLIGCAAGFAIHYPLWMLGVEKAGDAKLFMGIGACVGWRELVEASIWLAIVYVPVALLLLTVQGKLPNLLKSVRYLLDRAKGVASEPPEQTFVRAGPIILVAGLLGRFTGWLAGLI
ncbi:MAG: prepilin peptidase [Myxococcales bacterium]|nr:prepilin peptidase [Myxococcales bacterium]